MAIALLFWVVLITSLLLVMSFGSRGAKAFAGLLVLATIATGIVKSQMETSQSAIAYAAIDGLVLLVAGFMLVRSQAYWPIWFCGFQLITVASEVTRLITPSALPSMYANMAGFWSVPALMTMAIGVYRDRAVQLSR